MLRNVQKLVDILFLFQNEQYINDVILKLSASTSIAIIIDLADFAELVLLIGSWP